VVQAVNETKGQVVTYQKDVVVTPYFGHSDGMTRTWSSVFGGKDKPWLVPVVTPYDQGLTMFGHGVGMSANDAYGHAKTDLWDYTKILKYYYNGIEVSKIY
jgi:peptidoglycan hydrolase-like amidase